MTSIRNKFAVVETTLVSAVADDGTFTVAYPTGFTQLSFTAGLAKTTGYLIINGNDRWSEADPGFSVSYGASEITVTNLSAMTWAAGSTVKMHLEVQDGRFRIPFIVPLPPLATLTNADIVTEVRPGIEGTIEHAEFVTTIAATTASKAATLNLEIDTTNVTGGTIALTSANVTPKGAAIAAAAITGANTLTRDSKLSVEASSVTAFVEGEGYLIIYIRPTAHDQY